MDYKDLKALIDKVIGETDVMIQLENEKAELEKTGAGTILTNFDKFVTPEVENWGDIIRKLSKLTDNYDFDKTSRITKKDLSISVRVLHVGGYGYRNYFRIGKSEYDFNGLRFNLSSIKQNGADTDGRTELLEYMSHFFGSEELTMDFLKNYRTLIKDVICYFEDIIGNKSEKLRLAIQNLNYMLESFSTVEEKEDGTVTIHLGNKTFVGKLEEAENE